MYESLTEAINAGVKLHWERGPFIRTYRPDIAAGRSENKLFQYNFCIPIRSYPKGCSNIDVVYPRRILSVMWHGRVTDLMERTLTLAETARTRGLTPTGWFHLILLLGMDSHLPGEQSSRLLQLGAIVE